MQKLWCVSFNEFKNIAFENKWNEQVPNNIAIISINNSANLICDDECHICNGENVLNLNFDDADPMVFGLEECEEIDKYTYKSKIDGLTYVTLQFFNEEMAKQSIEFIENNIDKDFYIHCSAGVSRSQAFVRFIQNTYFEKTFETNPNNPCRFPNGYVLSKLNEIYRKQNNIF